MKRQIVIAARKPVMVDLVCPSCGSELTGEKPAPGEYVECPQCHRFFFAPTPTEDNPQLSRLIALSEQQTDDLHQIRNCIAAVLIGNLIVVMVWIVLALVRSSLAT